MKKVFLTAFSVLGMIPFASAQANLPGPPQALQGVVDMFNVLLNSQFGGSNSDMVARLLIFSLISLLLYKPAEMIMHNKKFGALVAAIVGIMAVRFFTPQMVRGLFLPYEALGVVISIIIPFVLIELLIFPLDKKLLRTLGHVLMAGIFTMMWLFRFSEIGDLAYYYLGATVLSIFTLSMDTKFRKWLAKSRLGGAKSRMKLLRSIELEKEYKQALDALMTAIALNKPQAEIEAAKKIVEDLENKLHILGTL